MANEATTEALPEAQAPAPLAERPQPAGTRILLITVALAVACGAIAGAGAALLAAPKQRLAAINLASVIEIEQLRTTVVLMQPETTEDERIKTMSRVSAFGRTLERAVAEVTAECKCVLLASHSVVSLDVPDVTPLVLRRLDLEGIDIAALRVRAERGLSKRLPSADDLARTARGARTP